MADERVNLGPFPALFGLGVGLFDHRIAWGKGDDAPAIFRVVGADEPGSPTSSEFSPCHGAPIEVSPDAGFAPTAGAPPRRWDGPAPVDPAP